MNTIFAFGLLAVAGANAVSVTKSSSSTISGNDRFTFASQMGAAISGASVNAAGELFAVNQTRFMSLRTGDIDPTKPLIIGPIDGSVSFTDSRFTKSSGQFIADAAGHAVWQNNPNGPQGSIGSLDTRQPKCRGRRNAEPEVGPGRLVKRASTPLFVQNEMIQPSSMAIHSDEIHLYLSGGLSPSTTTAGTSGDLWWFNTENDSLQKVGADVLKAAGIHRVNGIEISSNDKWLYLASGETKDNSIVASKIFRFEIDATTFGPKNPKLVLDLYPALSAIGVDAKGQGMEAMGMRTDIDGNLFITLNRGKSILKWKIEDSAANAEFITLTTVSFPVSLELGGGEGKTLYIVGRCDDGVKSCVDVLNNDVAGRAWANLNGKNTNAGGAKPKAQEGSATSEEEGTITGSGTESSTSPTSSPGRHLNHDLLDPFIIYLSEVYASFFGN